jgi:hypothetical protein
METTTKRQFVEAIRDNGESAADVEGCFYQDLRTDAVVPCRLDGLPDIPYYAGHGGIVGHPAIVFTKDYIYIKCQYDGLTWVEPIPRHPAVVVRQQVIPIPGGG